MELLGLSALRGEKSYSERDDRSLCQQGRTDGWWRVRVVDTGRSGMGFERKGQPNMDLLLQIALMPRKLIQLLALTRCRDFRGLSPVASFHCVRFANRSARNGTSGLLSLGMRAPVPRTGV